jgi:hypothetical protein
MVYCGGWFILQMMVYPADDGLSCRGWFILQKMAYSVEDGSLCRRWLICEMVYPVKGGPS